MESQRRQLCWWFFLAGARSIYLHSSAMAYGRAWSTSKRKSKCALCFRANTTNTNGRSNGLCVFQPDALMIWPFDDKKIKMQALYGTCIFVSPKYHQAILIHFWTRDNSRHGIKLKEDIPNTNHTHYGCPKHLWLQDTRSCKIHTNIKKLQLEGSTFDASSRNWFTSEVRLVEKEIGGVYDHFFYHLWLKTW